MTNAARADGDPQGMLSLTRVQKKAPFLPDVSYREYGQHITIAPLLPPDEEGLGLCGRPQDFAIGAFHCKGSGKSGKQIFWAPPVFWKAPPGELLMLTGCNGKTWGSTGSVPDRHEVQMAPLDTFMKLQATNGVPVLPEYAFTLCSTSTWLFPSPMDLNILPEACLAYNTPADSENVPEDPANTEPENKARSSKKHRKRKGKSKTQSKSTGATSGASEMSSRCKDRKPQTREELVMQVNQDLHLSSDGSDSKNLEEAHQDTPTNEELLPPADTTWTESGANPLGTSAPPDLTTPAPQPGIDPGKGENAIPNQEDDVNSTLVQPVTPVDKPDVPDPAEEAQLCPAATPTTSTVLGGDASANPVPSGSNLPPGYPAPAGTPNPDTAQLVPSSIEALELIRQRQT